MELTQIMIVTNGIDNDPKALCYNCQVCKLGVAQDVKKAWNISGTIVITSCLLIASCFILGCIIRKRECEKIENEMLLPK